MTKEQAAKNKAEWLSQCLGFGYEKSELDMLSKVWDKFKDEHGNFRPHPESTPSDSGQDEMDEAVGFAEWIENNGWWGERFEEDGTTRRPHILWSNEYPDNYITTAELYDIYLSNKQ